MEIVLACWYCTVFSVTLHIVHNHKHTFWFSRNSHDTVYTRQCDNVLDHLHCLNLNNNVEASIITPMTKLLIYHFLNCGTLYYSTQFIVWCTFVKHVLCVSFTTMFLVYNLVVKYVSLCYISTPALIWQALASNIHTAGWRLALGTLKLLIIKLNI